MVGGKEFDGHHCPLGTALGRDDRFRSGVVAACRLSYCTSDTPVLHDSCIPVAASISILLKIASFCQIERVHTSARVADMARAVVIAAQARSSIGALDVRKNSKLSWRRDRLFDRPRPGIVFE